MAAVPAESSRSHGKGLGLSQSHSSSALDYSGDTFESFSEEEEESEAPGSRCSTEDLEGAAVSEALESSSSLAGQSAAEEEFEAVDPAAVERAAIGKWIDAMGKWIDLKNKDTGIRPDKSVIRTPAGAAEFSQGELGALRSFCSRRISRMQQEQAGKGRKLQWGDPARQTETGDSCAVPAQLMNRILLENTREAVKQVTEAEIHEVSSCPDCQQKEAELAKVAFLRQKKTLLEGALIQEKLEEQFYSRDMLTLLGEALKSFPKPSEDPRDLWQRLKGQEWKD
ncbi:uncharacterized protein C8orf48 homolog [Onychostruthus taczanowskii]|uniref:uncharacterized protein C8orf48 homolog n=1 Tax=Onychostruthus taczanowskii TaxID=356909 RepID=UPI001B7FF9A8|nr:uncharacterized protein C8orf48 homolog [Onychostruthus taczanowskii]XP_041280340.1 uncharacterized protein C8orf48 homolog [Onychostruthus taczanowskii]XP_041280341.1 uncharacterized protein C8orf48 homolog [Onychostruthus taczanowskii]XP_041280342.1 uncharacterized protein C8orf48 homolog [Onychostruthus taczanowskii]